MPRTTMCFSTQAIISSNVHELETHKFTNVIHVHILYIFLQCNFLFYHYGSVNPWVLIKDNSLCYIQFFVFFR